MIDNNQRLLPLSIGGIELPLSKETITQLQALQKLREAQYVPVTNQNMGKITEAIKAAIKRGKLHHA